MKRYPNARVALSAVAAIVGAGFASGREIMAFFSQMGWASWIGIPVAAAAAGFLSAVVCKFAMRTGARSFPGIYGKVMNRACEDSVTWLYGLMMLLTAAAMLAAGAELALLSLPFPHAAIFGVIVTLGVAVACTHRSAGVLALLGAALVPLVFAYYTGMALDTRPAPVYVFEAGKAIFASPLAALLLGMLYAAFNVTMAGGVICLNTTEGARPATVGWYVASLLLLLLIPANAAFLLAGPNVRELALPSVVLAARWGTFGFYASIVALWAAVITTLCAALASMREQLIAVGVRPKPGVIWISALAVVFAFVGFEPLVDIGYPLLGWTCSIALIVLMVYL